MRKKTLLYSLLKPLAIAAVAILPLNTVHAQSSAEVPALETLTGELKIALSNAIPFATHEYQYTNTNSVDVFAGYLTVNRSTFQYGGPLPFTYSWPNDYYPSAGNIGPVDALYNAYTYAEQLGYPEYKAIAQIVYGMTALRATNVKGAISYVDSRALKATRPLSYQSQEEAYEMILADLDEAIATLETEQPDAATLQAIEGDDLAQGTATAAYSGYNWRNWVKLANTIKLRLAMCLAKPDPSLAQQVATEALSGTGVLDDDFGPTWVKGADVHPAYSISSTKEGWADCRMSASIENAMKRLGNPLIGTFFTTTGQINDKTTGASMLAAGKDYVGIRQGVTMEPKSAGVGYYNFSEVNTPVKFIRPTWVCKEEVLFLKAEAALRWGIGGSAQQYYEAGIRAVFNRYGVSEGLDEYLARTEMVRKNGKNIDYIDYYVNSNSCDGRIAIGVKWDEGESNETKLEKIITQKWIAMFPNGGYEAWTDFRRTGYPRLFPVPEANKWTGTPTFPVELQLRRVPYDESDENVLIDIPNIENALTVFGQAGQNAGGMRMYFEGDPAEYPWTYDEDESVYSYGWPIPKNFTSTSGVEEILGELRTALSSAVTSAQHAYQYENTNTVDVFAGYLAVNRSTFQYGGPLPFTYCWPNDYYPSAGNIGPVDALYNAYTYAEQLGYPEYKAIAQIVYGMTALRATNVKGAISYVDSRNLKSSRPLSYQSQEEAYNMILSDLNEAIATLEQVQPDAATLQAIEGEDIAQGTATAAYSGYNWQNWVKLANTIKLRLAMCLAKPDPKLARRVANEALSGTGVLDDDFGPTWVKGTDVHPAYYISSSKEGLGDCRMSASIENAMKRLGNPLIGTFFTTNSAQINDKTTGASMLAAGKDYVGIRQGVTMEPKSAGVGYYNFSEVNTPVKYIRPTWVCKEEVLFLKAEAALRWGIGGSAQQYYEAGIRAVFNRYGVSEGLDEYLARTEMVRKNGKNIDYIDYYVGYVGSNSCPGRIEIGVAWNDGDSDETKLEKIITQKWISMFPNGGYEAWTDFRRTGYPRLFPVPEANKWTGTPTFPVELQLRRVPYNESDENVLIDIPNIEAALTVFGIPGFNGGGMRMYFEGDPSIYPWCFDEDESVYSYGWPIPNNRFGYSGVEEIQDATEQSIKLYPVPATSTVTVAGSESGTEIAVYTIGGMKVKSVQSVGDRTVIDVTDLSSGIYVVTAGAERLRMIKR